jgi:O-6-methylguanine DNA methyltransferase
MTVETQLARLRGVAPPSVAAGALLGTGLVDGYRLFESPIGEVVVAFNPAGVSAVDLAEDEAFVRFETRFGRHLAEALPPHGWERMIARAIELGRPGSLPLDLRSSTAFQQEVLIEAATIPRGEVRSYGWVARRAGSPKAARAVGSVMASNPVPLIVPCHRVVRSDGDIGRYSLGGPHRKRELLAHEGIDPEAVARLAGLR